jgi:hypothetical protein
VNVKDLRTVPAPDLWPEIERRVSRRPDSPEPPEPRAGARTAVIAAALIVGLLGVSFLAMTLFGRPRGVPGSRPTPALPSTPSFGTTPSAPLESLAARIQRLQRQIDQARAQIQERLRSLMANELHVLRLREVELLAQREDDRRQLLATRREIRETKRRAVEIRAELAAFRRRSARLHAELRDLESRQAAVSAGTLEECSPVPFAPSYLPWLSEGEPVPRPEQRSEAQGDLLMTWSGGGRRGWEGAGITLVTLFVTPEPGQDAMTVPVRGTEGALTWIGDPGVGELSLTWSEDGAPCGSYRLHLLAGSLTERQAEAELLRIAESLG